MKIGDKVKCIKHTTTGTSLYPSEKLLNVVSVDRDGTGTFRTKEHMCFFYQCEFKVIPQTVEELCSELKEITKTFEIQSKQLQTKIDYMTETGLSEFDDTQYKVWAVLSELDGKNPDKLSTAKAIATIISQ